MKIYKYKCLICFVCKTLKLADENRKYCIPEIHSSSGFTESCVFTQSNQTVCLWSTFLKYSEQVLKQQHKQQKLHFMYLTLLYFLNKARRIPLIYKCNKLSSFSNMSDQEVWMTRVTRVVIVFSDLFQRVFKKENPSLVDIFPC